jgi:hypothetical protein
MFVEKVEGITVDGQIYDTTGIINKVRSSVDSWRQLKDSKNWGVTPETARLLQHWRHHKFNGVRPFFCQVEAVETAIWLSEVAPKNPQFKWARKYLEAASGEANPELFRIALKLATGAGKTTVMAMLIAWQTVNANRRPGSKQFANGFLIVAPGITIRDRLRVLLPNDTESYYLNRELIPDDMRMEIQKARIVITNYHAFQLREKIQLSAGNRKFLQGRGPDLNTRETESEMVRRVMGDLMGIKNIVVLNDEAHHCYREKQAKDDDFIDDHGNPITGSDLTEAKKAAKKQNEYARLWINGLEAVKRTMGVSTVFDLSATPFFLAGSGYREGTLFPWVMSDFSLMDAIECGIVKLPRVPIADNTVTHILGVRAFGTQLLCEQVVGRGLRQQSYELNSNGLFDAEYSDILGIPFDFTAKPVVATPKPPKPTVRVHAVRPERDALELTFPRVTGYRAEIPEGRLTASFTDDSTYTLTPDVVGPSRTVISGIVGKTEELNVQHLKDERQSTILFKLTTRLIETKYRDDNGELQLHLFGQLKRIVRQWLDNHLVCVGDTYPAQILMREMSDEACNRIVNAINATDLQAAKIQALLDPFNPTGSTAHVNFNTSKDTWKTDPQKSHLNLVVTDSD